MNTPNIVEDEWDYALSLMPENLEALCRSKLALSRKRVVTCAQDYLRLCLAYAVCDMSLRQTAMWAGVVGLGHLSDVAVLKRLRAAPQWLGAVLAEWFYRRGLTKDAPKRKVRLLDATTVSQPGSKGTDWRLHLRMDLERRRIEWVELTDASGGERLDRHEIESEEIVLADRVYATNKGIAHVLNAGGHVVVRSTWSNLKLRTQSGGKLKILAPVETLDVDEVGDWLVVMEHEGKHYSLRLVAIRKSPVAAERSRRDLRREAKKKGRQLRKETLKAAGFVFVVTDLNSDAASAVEVLELYRTRWQVELVFKRLKSILGLSNLRAKDKRLCQTYFLSKILGALVVEELSGQALDFFPWGFRLHRTSG